MTFYESRVPRIIPPPFQSSWYLEIWECIPWSYTILGWDEWCELMSFLSSHCDADHRQAPFAITKSCIRFFVTDELVIVHQLHQNSAVISNLLIILFYNFYFLPRRYCPVGSEPSWVPRACEVSVVHLPTGWFGNTAFSTFSFVFHYH